MPLHRRAFLKTAGLVAASNLAVLFGGFVFLNESEDPVVDRVTIPIQGLHPALEGFTIVQLTDIHLLPYTQPEMIQKVVSITNSLKADLVVLTGDFVWRDRTAIYILPPLLAGLNARFGVYSVMGNHDYWLDIQALQAEFDRHHLPVLYNQGVPLGVGKGTLYLAGMDDGWSGMPDLRKAIEGAPSSSPIVLLLHEPDLVDQTSLEPRISFQLSGHTHGGQVLIRGKNPPFKPYLGKKYSQGLFKVRNTWLYTSRGLGTISVPLRINCPPEITHLTLVA
jgi:uncharacterized protein